MHKKTIAKILAVTAAIFATPAVVHAQDASVRRAVPANAAPLAVLDRKETQMTPSTIQGPQGSLVAFRINNGKTKGLPLSL